MAYTKSRRLLRRSACRRYSVAYCSRRWRGAEKKPCQIPSSLSRRGHYDIKTPSRQGRAPSVNARFTGRQLCDPSSTSRAMADQAEPQSEIREPLLPEPEPVRPESGNSTHRLTVDIPIEPVDLEAASESTRAAVQAEASNEELGVESLDYDPVFSVVHAKSSRAKQHRRVYGYTGLTLAKWSVTICIGLLVGLVACLVDSSQEFIVSWKKAFVERTAGRSLILSFLGFSSISVLLVLVSSCLVLFWAPPAAGGGVTLVMAYLNGNDIPDFFRFSTLLTKIIGTICSISSGLLVGQEAPMVHIGAAIASFLTWMPLKSPVKSGAKAAFHFDFHNDRDRREFITAGAAAGLAAAFGAPVGGVLYSLEEASSFWSKKVMWRSLLCCTCATMLLALINQWEYSTSLPGTMAFRHLRPWFEIRDLPFFIVTSVFAGIIGAFVNIAHGWVDRFRPAANRKYARILEAAFVTVLSITVIFGLPLALGNCLPIPDSELPDAKMDEKYWVTYTCSGGEYNDLATLFFSLPRKNMRQLYDMQNAQMDYPTANLGIHAASVLVLFIIAYGTATPGGIFMPSMLAGASFGAFMGRIFEFIFPGENIQPGLHAVVGTTAMLGGVFRASISLVVIMVEATGGIDFILPIITAIVVSNWVAHHIYHTGAYEADLERLGGVYFLHGEPPHQLVAITAADVMSSTVNCFNEVVSVAEVVEVLRNTRHNGFPVLRQDSHGSKFVGLILRHQILLLLEQGFFTETDPLHPSRHLKFSLYEKRLPEEMQILERAMQVYHHQHYPHRRYLSSRPQALQDIGVEDIIARRSSEASSQDGTGQQPKRILALDLRPFMNRAPLTVRRECSAQRVYTIFRTLGLRHLCVTDSHNRVVGIITRKDIAMAQKQGFMKKSLQHWDSDTRSFVEAEKEANKNKNKIYHLP